MFLTSGGTEAWIYTGQKKNPHAEKKFCLVNSEDQQTPLLRLISGFNSSLSPIPQSRLHGRFYIWLKAQAHMGLFLHWAEVSKFEYLSPCRDDCTPMQRPDNISSKWFCRIYHRARSPFTCALHSSRSFQHLWISKGVTQQCCVVWNPIGKQCCIQQETYLCMHWCNA